MVLFLLSLKVDMEGIQSLSLNSNASICLTVKNPLSDYETRDKIVVDPNTTIDDEDGGGSSRDPNAPHFVISWEGSKKKSTLRILSESEVKTAMKKNNSKKKKGGGKAKNDLQKEITENDVDEFVPLLAMECRGLEPSAYHISFGNEFKVVSTGGVTFEDVDLTEGDWGEYDEKNDEALTINSIESKFISI